MELWSEFLPSIDLGIEVFFLAKDIDVSASFRISFLDAVSLIPFDNAVSLLALRLFVASGSVSGGVMKSAVSLCLRFDPRCEEDEDCGLINGARLRLDVRLDLRWRRFFSTGFSASSELNCHTGASKF